MPAARPLTRGCCRERPLLTNYPGGNIVQQTLHQDVTVNEALGFRFTKPLAELAGFRSHFQAGLSDYKNYSDVSFEKHNDFIFTRDLDQSLRPAFHPA